MEDERLIELERHLPAMRAAQTEWVRRIEQLTDELVQNGTLLEQAAAEAKKRAGLEQRELQAELDELLLSHDQALEQAQYALPPHITSRGTEANERSQRELAEVHAKLEARMSELAAVCLRLTDAEDGWAKSKAERQIACRDSGCGKLWPYGCGPRYR